MRYRKIVLAGGSGYLGRVLSDYYKDKAEEIVVLGRKMTEARGNVKTVVWDGITESDWIETLENADLLINLCGKNVNCRYREANQKEIINSRIIPTKLLGQAIQKLKYPPKLWINITSATIYRHAEDLPQDEENGDIGYGFSIDVCRKWEDTFFGTITPDTRKIALRMGIVLGRSDGAFPRLLNLVKYGLGGKQGDGGQYISWIHEQDAAKCTEWLLNQDDLEGVINCTAPYPMKNKDFMETIRSSYGMPVGLPSPAWLLGLGAWLIGTETELILKSRWVVPNKLLTCGYQFLFPKAEYAVKDILSIRI